MSTLSNESGPGQRAEYRTHSQKGGAPSAEAYQDVCMEICVHLFFIKIARKAAVDADMIVMLTGNTASGSCTSVWCCLIRVWKKKFSLYRLVEIRCVVISTSVIKFVLDSCIV